MKILSNTTAIAGKMFDISIKGQPSGVTTKTIVKIDGNTIFSHDCDDPPCHETFAVPENAHGRNMIILAESAPGEVAKVEVPIRLEL